MNVRPSRILLGIVGALSLIATLGFGKIGHVSAGSIIYVKFNAGGAGTGASWTDAYQDLQVALSSSVSGDQIWVAKGSYRPTSGLDNTISFHLKTGVAIYGGFAGGETALGKRNPGLNVTILSGDIGSPGVDTDNSDHVVDGSFTGSTAVLDGFRILGATRCATNGGGMFNSFGSPTLRNLTFIGNRAFFGGGMYNDHGNPTLTKVTFSGNQGLCGGGVGGGMYNTNSNPTLTNVTFSGNVASFAGGMYNGSSSPTLRNVTFSGNTTTLSSDGQAMMQDGTSAPVVYDSIFWGDGSSEISVAAGTLTLANALVQGGCPTGATCTGLTTGDPMLGALQNNGGFTPTMALGANSAAINAGNNSTCAAVDQRGVTRPQGLTCDVGAYEVRVKGFTSAALFDGDVLETGKGTQLGGAVSSASATLRVGDDAANRRFRGFVSFDTSGLPDGATVVAANLFVRQQSKTGNPFPSQGTLLADVAKPFFGAQVGLVSSDWQAAAALKSAGSFGSTLLANGDWYKAPLTTTALPKINKTGTTQFRLRFATQVNNGVAQFLAFSSGEAAAASRPALWVFYNP